MLALPLRILSGGTTERAVLTAEASYVASSTIVVRYGTVSLRRIVQAVSRYAAQCCPTRRLENAAVTCSVGFSAGRLSSISITVSCCLSLAVPALCQYCQELLAISRYCSRGATLDSTAYAVAFKAGCCKIRPGALQGLCLAGHAWSGTMFLGLWEFGPAARLIGAMFQAQPCPKWLALRPSTPKSLRQGCCYY